MKQRRALLLSLIVALALCAIGGWWLHKEQQQYRLNRQLIEALSHDELSNARGLVEEGADPNTHFTPPPMPSLKLLLNKVLHYGLPPANTSPTAFLLACGARWQEQRNGGSYWLTPEESIPLLQTMLAHGAQCPCQRRGPGNRSALCLHEPPPAYRQPASSAWCRHQCPGCTGVYFLNGFCLRYGRDPSIAGTWRRPYNTECQRRNRAPLDCQRAVGGRGRSQHAGTRSQSQPTRQTRHHPASICPKVEERKPCTPAQRWHKVNFLSSFRPSSRPH